MYRLFLIFPMLKVQPQSQSSSFGNNHTQFIRYSLRLNSTIRIINRRYAFHIGTCSFPQKYPTNDTSDSSYNASYRCSGSRRSFICYCGKYTCDNSTTSISHQHPCPCIFSLGPFIIIIHKFSTYRQPTYLFFRQFLRSPIQT